MPAIRTCISTIIRSNIADRSEYSQLQTGYVYCHPCSKNIFIDRHHISHQLKTHEKSAKHKKNYESWRVKKTVQTSIENVVRDQDNPFYYDLAEFFIGCNIPFSKLDSSICRQFIKKYIGTHAPDESTLRKNYLPKIYNTTIEKIREKIGDNWIYIQADESTDSRNRPVVSVLVGSLDGNKPISYLLDVVYLTGAANHIKMYQVINESLRKLWPSEIFYDRVRLLVSDQAKYMLKTGTKMKETLFPKMLHVSCLAHSCHRVAELARTNSSKVNELVSGLKKIFIKCPRRRNEFVQSSGVAMPKFPIQTRWGTWLLFTEFLESNFEAIKSYIEGLDSSESAAIKSIKERINDSQLLDELVALNKLFIICGTITKLETIGLDIYEQKGLIDNLMEKLPHIYKQKLQSSLAMNPDFTNIFNFNTLEEKKKYSHAPLVSVDVERSFSRLKTIFTSLRESFTEINFRNYAVANYNAHIDE